MKKILVNILLLLVTLVFSIVMTEFAFRIVKKPASGWEKKIIFHPELFTIEPPSIVWSKKTDEFETRIETNEQGFRGKSFPPITDLLFIGDSMTAAHQVDEDKRFSSLLHGVALGMNGADPIQELQFYRKIGKFMKPKIVVHQVFLFNDLVEIGPHFTIKNDRVESIIPQKTKEAFCMMFWNIKSYFLMRVCQFSHYQINQFTQKSTKVHKYDILDAPKDINPTLMVIRTFQEEVERDGGRYILLLIPHPKEIDGMTALHQKILAELPDIEIIDPMKDFRESKEILYFPYDGHLTEAGHRRIASLVLRQLGHPLHKKSSTSNLDSL